MQVVSRAKFSLNSINTYLARVLNVESTIQYIYTLSEELKKIRGGNFGIRSLEEGSRIKLFHKRATEVHGQTCYSKIINYHYTVHIALSEEYCRLYIVMTFSEQT
jgi:hypothetical protein